MPNKTIIIPKIKTIELTGDRIEVKLNHGAVLVDDDAGNEGRGLPSVDFFIKPFDSDGSPDNGKVIVRAIADETRQRTFLTDAKRWGKVREDLAEPEELRPAQRMFYFGYSVAERVIREFSRALDAGDVSQESQGWPFYVTLVYTNPLGEEKTCTAHYTGGVWPGDSRQLVSFTIVEMIGGRKSDQVSIHVADPALIDRLRPALDTLIQTSTL